MKKIMALFATVIILSGLLAGCSSSPPGNTSTAPSESISAGSAWPQTYIDALGNEVTLESRPQRVISGFHAMFPDYCYTFGVSPIAVASAENRFNHLSAYQSYITAQKPEDIGAYNALDFEKILAMQPDLIIITKLQEDSYKQLSQIAPTIVLDHTQINGDWQYGVREFSKIFGEPEKADEIIAAVQNSVAEGAQNLGEFREKNETVIFLAITSKELYPYSVTQLKTVYSSVDEGGLGLTAPQAYTELTDYSQAISLESIAADYDPDHIFIIMDNVDGDAAEYIGQLERSSVWNNLSAVKNGNVYKIDRSIFGFNAPIATQFGVKFVVSTLTSPAA